MISDFPSLELFHIFPAIPLEFKITKKLDIALSKIMEMVFRTPLSFLSKFKNDFFAKRALAFPQILQFKRRNSIDISIKKKRLFSLFYANCEKRVGHSLNSTI